MSGKSIRKNWKNFYLSDLTIHQAKEASAASRKHRKNARVAGVIGRLLARQDASVYAIVARRSHSLEKRLR
jgi:hypothetical protein